MGLIQKIFGDVKTYPTEWEEQEPETIERKVKRQKYSIKLENGDEIVTEADYVKMRGGKRFYYDIEDMELRTGSKKPRLRKITGDAHLEVRDDEVAAVKYDTVSTRIYRAENVRFKTRNVREQHHRFTRIGTETELLSKPEIKEIRQSDTE